MAEVGFLLRVCLNDFPVLIFFFQLPDVQKSTELVSEFLSEGTVVCSRIVNVSMGGKVQEPLMSPSQWQHPDFHF